MFWRRKRKRPSSFICTECGVEHSNWPAFAFESPDNYFSLSASDKEEHGSLSADFCEIRYPDQIDRFIRGVLSQKVTGSCEGLDYGLWVSVSEASFKDYQAHFNNEDYEKGYFGWLCNQVPAYESTMLIPCNVWVRQGGNRPEIVPHKEHAHRLVEDYYQGISLEEAEARIKSWLNNG